jgi:hypothetical protein
MKLRTIALLSWRQLGAQYAASVLNVFGVVDGGHLLTYRLVAVIEEIQRSGVMSPWLLLLLVGLSADFFKVVEFSIDARYHARRARRLQLLFKKRRG